MKLFNLIVVGFGSLLLLFACASDPKPTEVSADAPVKSPCASADAPTGSSIKTHKCSPSSQAVNVDPDDMANIIVRQPPPFKK